jgi:hypothetical protein
MTQTLEVPNPYQNPSPRRVFLTDAAAIDAHHRMVTSPAFQLAISVAQREYARAICSLDPLGKEDENSIHGHALHLARLQGANDFVAMLCGLAELPPPPPKVKNPDNLDEN